MAFEEGREVMVCPACSACHDARWSRMPVKEPMKVRCQACGSVMYDAKSHRDYHEVRLKAQT